LSKRNRGKKTTPHTKAFGYLALHSKQGVCGTRYAQTVLDEIPLLASVAQLGAKGAENLWNLNGFIVEQENNQLTVLDLNFIPFYQAE
jgi:hypothetical protein